MTRAVQLDRRTRHERALEHAFYSMLLPGLGQVAQRRLGAAAIQFASVAAYVIGAFGVGGRRALLFGLLWNAWSVIDAWRHEAD